MERKVKSTRSELNIEQSGVVSALFLQLCQEGQIITSVGLVRHFMDGGHDTAIHRKQIVILDGLRVAGGRSRRLGTVS